MYAYNPKPNKLHKFSNLIRDGLSALLEGAAWTASAFIGNWFASKTRKSSMPYLYAIDSLSVGLGCTLAGSTPMLLSKLLSDSNTSVEEGPIAPPAWDISVGMFLNNALWQPSYTLWAYILGQESFGPLFTLVGSSAFAISMTLATLKNTCLKPTTATANWQSDLKNAFITFVISGLFVFTNAPSDNSNPFYIITGYGDQPESNMQLLLDIVKSSALNTMGYIGSLAFLFLASKLLKTCLPICSPTTAERYMQLA